MPAGGSAARAPNEDARQQSAFWDISDIQFHCRISRSTAWRLVRTEGFPPPAVLGKRSVIWPRGEVLDFVESRRESKHYGLPMPVDDSTAPATFTVRTIRARSRR